MERHFKINFPYYQIKKIRAITFKPKEVLNVLLLFLILLVLPFLLFPNSASAYVGPGAGLSVVGTIIALIVAIVLAIIGFIWYPFKRLFMKFKASRGQTK